MPGRRETSTTTEPADVALSSRARSCQIGIIQGRLTHPWNGELQCFPRGCWESEFLLARDCGLDYIELIAETVYNQDNPIWSTDGRRHISELTRKTGVRTTTLCADCFMSVTFGREPEVSLKLLGTLLGYGFECIVLPFLEGAAPRSVSEAKKAFDRVAPLAERGVKLAIESALPADSLLPLIEGTPLSVCYDLGNRSALGYDIIREIYRLGPLISHVHVKDKRLSDGQNVILGTGDTDLRGAFHALREIGYMGRYTLETNRGDDPIKTACAHRALVEELLR